jgi:triacylglycerol lipase
MPTTTPKAKAPILLAHGIAPFDVFFKRFRKSFGLFLPPQAARWFDETIGDDLHYFRNIRRALEGEGFQAYETEVSFAASVEQRAQDLRHEVQRTLAGGGHEQVNIIAHSMGGLDSRHMILMDEMAGRVASLVTIGTPHGGTSFADWGLANLDLADDLIGLLKFANLDLTGFRDLTQDRCRAFNRQAEAREADNAVVYITYAASQVREQTFLPLQPSWGIIEEREGVNDGLVPVASQRWQPELRGAARVKPVEQRDVPVAADHLNELGWSHPWVQSDLGPEGYERTIREMYVNMAEGLRARGLYR